MKKLFSLSFLLVISLMSFCTFAQSNEQQLLDYLSNFRSMSADFNQTVYVNKKTSKRSAGKMALQRPGKFRWEITEPNRQLIIADGRYLWIYNVDLEQATKQPLTTNNNSPASLLSGSTDTIRDRFNITTVSSSGSTSVFKLFPKSDKEMIESIELHFQDKKLFKMFLVDNLGQKTEFVFSNVQINPTLAAGLFVFKPGKNIDIIQSR